MTTTKRYNIIRISSNETRAVEVTDRQDAIILGTLVGDATIGKRQNTNSWRFKVSHCDAQKGLVDWKYKELKSFSQGNQGPKLCQSGQRFPSWDFYLRSGTYFEELYNLFYIQSIPCYSKKSRWGVAI